jgi:hypothetical protein
MASLEIRTMSLRTLGLALGVLAIAPLTACSPTIRQPRLLHPGPASVQRYNAVQFDPYPQPDMGPEIVGGRPIDYITPVPPQQRALQFREGERPIELATPGTAGMLTRAPAVAPVFTPTGPPSTVMPGVPTYAAAPPPAPQIGVPQPVPAMPTFTTPVATQMPASTQPPVQHRY